MCKMHFLFVVLSFFLFGFSDSSFAKQDIFVKDDIGKSEKNKRAAGEIIVKFKAGVSEDKIREINNKYNCSVLSISKNGKFRRLRIPNYKMIDEMVELYNTHENVEYAEENIVAYAMLTPNDPFFDPYQWHLDNPAYGGIQTKSAWDIHTGNSSVIVAVIDTGVAYEDYDKYFQAPDLSNTSFVAGYDFVNNDDHPNDDNSHGTHVTGTIAQSTDNSLGTAGVAFNASIMPIKVLNRNGSGFVSDIADGIYYAADHGAAIINMSLGSTSPSQTEEDALAYAYNKGVTIFCSAGNEYQEGNPTVYPAAYDAYCIAVGATRFDETRSYYSNTGSYVDITAPGGDTSVDQNGDGYGDGILQQTINPRSKKTDDFGYWFFQGTSMASPHAAGVAALLIANGIAGPDKIKEALESTAEDKGTAGWDEEYGWGIIDAVAALSYSPDPIHDIVVTNLSSPTLITQGDSVSVVVSLENQGDFDETFTVTLTDTTDSTEIGNQSVTLSSGNTIDLTYDWVTTEATSVGDHILLAETSIIQDETNTGNNVLTATSTVQTPVHDIAVIALDVPLASNQGDMVSVSATVQNQGTYSETTTVNLTDITSNMLIDSHVVSDLNAGETNIVTFSWDTTGTSLGDHELMAEATSVEGETDTSDNSMISTITINDGSVTQLHVEDITAEFSIKGKNYTAIASVTVADESGNLMSGVVVSGDWILNNNYLNSDAQITDSAGIAALESDKERAQTNDTFIFNIINLEKSGYTYDSTSNSKNSVSISVP